MATYLKHDDIQDLPLAPYMIEHIGFKDVDKFEALENVNLMSFVWLDILHPTTDYEKLTICQTKEQIYFICETQEMLEKAQSLLSLHCLPDKELYSFFANLLKNDIDQMEDLEERITDMEDVLLKDNTTDYTLGIISFRKELMRLRRYYEQLSQVFDGISENENQLFSKVDLRYFKFLEHRTDRLIGHIINLRDYITQVREAYQAQVDIEQNKIMKFFTVITSIFLPLTLIAGWYGMNLKLPEFGWRYGYLYVTILSILVVAAMIFYFKKKKWF